MGSLYRSQHELVFVFKHGRHEHIIAEARALVHDRAGFVVDTDATQAADDFLSVAEALALASREPDKA